MDLSFPRFEADASITVLPPDLAVLMVGIVARQAASPTALIHARLVRSPRRANWFAPAHGAFNPAVAQMLAVRAQEMNPAFTEPL